jgi:2-dehydropantoate 2-reductase
MQATGRATVAIIGLGSIGGAIAGSLRAADRHDIIACTRRPLDRLVLERPEGNVDLPLRGLTDPAAARPVDWVLLCTKTHQTQSTAPWLARLCGAATRVAVLQNGIDQAGRLGSLVGPAEIVPTIVYYNGERLGAERVRLRHAGPYDIAVADNQAGHAFAQLLVDTPLRILLSADFTTLSWQKLLLNAVANPITALTRQRQAVFRRADIGTLCRAILDEAVAVARAAGARLADDEAAQTMATLLTYPPDAGTSMYFDVIAGRKIEIEALTGAIVSESDRQGIAAPLNRALLTLLRAINDAARGGDGASDGK